MTFAERASNPARALIDGVFGIGLWRSGATVLLERLTRLLHVKPLFEPFQPELSGYRAILDRLVPAVRRAVDRHAAMVGRADAGDRQVRTRRLAGARAASPIRGTRPAYPAHAPGVPASLKAADGSDFRPDRIILRRLLLGVDDGDRRSSNLGAGLIDALDRGDAQHRLIAHWTFTEKFVDAHADDYTIVFYAAWMTGAFDLGGCLNRLGLRARPPRQLRSTAARRPLTARIRARANAWKAGGRCSAVKRRRVDAIVENVSSA